MEYERAPRSELLKTIEQQKDLIQRREQRLRDVIAAYKGIVKEKEALESSVKVLSQSKAKAHLEVPHSKGPSSDTASDRGQESDRESEDGFKSTNKDNTDPLNVSAKSSKDVESGVGDESEISELREQVETLSTSLLTLTQEKSKLEANYIAEKKTLKQEIEDLHKKLESEVRRVKQLEKDAVSLTQEWKNRVRSQQIEREKEQTDHAIMLRELQKLLATERQAKEQLEQQYDDAMFNMKEHEQLIPELTSKHEQNIMLLKEEVAALKNKLQEERTKSQQPSPMLLNLQKETDKLRAEHSRLLQEDRSRNDDAELKAQEYSKQCEMRIAELEAKLSELSESVGNYERLRYQDQQTVQRLKDRISQLDQENMALTEASTVNADDNLTDIPKLIERINKLKSQLRQANTVTEHPVNIEELLLEGLETEHPLVIKYRDELEQVKDEFERYRLRAQSVLKNKKESSPSKDEEMLRDLVNDLREKVRSLHNQREDDIEHYKQREDNVRKTMQVLQEKHKEEVSQLQAEYHSQVHELEEEIKKQRDRTVSMLAEKERELEVLRSTPPQRLQSEYIMRLRPNPDMAGASCERQNSEDEAVTRLLTTPPAGQGEMTLLYFAQEQARRDVDVCTLRKQKRDLESSLRDLQLSTSAKQEQLHEEIDRLNEEIRKRDRSMSREGANLEYLKNVTYKFLICHDPVGKQQMLNAITTILQFSPQEKTTVHAQNKGWWVGAS